MKCSTLLKFYQFDQKQKYFNIQGPDFITTLFTKHKLYSRSNHNTKEMKHLISQSINSKKTKKFFKNPDTSDF